MENRANIDLITKMPCKPRDTVTPATSTKPNAKAATPDAEYAVDRIVRHRTTRGGVEYRVRWYGLWDNFSPPWVGWRGEGYREGARSATRDAIKTVRTSSRKGSGSLAGYAQSPRSASTGATGNGLEANTRAKQPKRTYIGAKWTGASLSLFTVGDGC